jgi:hypothetical protein
MSTATAAVARWSRGTAKAVRHPRQALDQLTGPGPVYALLILFGLNAVDELDRTAFGILLPEIREEFGLDLTTILALIAVVTAGALVLQVPIAQYADRHRRVPVALGGAALGMILNIAGILPSLGTLNSLVFFLPHLAAFTLAHVGIRRAWPKAVWLALAIAVAESGRALLFAYLRSDVVSPIFAYAVGVLVGARSLRALRSVFLLPVYGMSAVAVIYFAAFAEVRGQSGGLERLESVAEVQATQQQYDVPTRHNLMTRLSSINQLTQVARVVEEDGYLNGETLEYLAYAWIPRFLWSEKPTIAKGAWFALRIGQARVYEGRITNSVNMTVPGELYLNYGWLGLMLGTCAFGAFLAVLWSAAGELRDDANILGNAFAYYLLWVGFGGGADLQIVVTLVANYALFLLVSIALPHTRPTSSRSAVARSRPSMVGTTQ